MDPARLSSTERRANTDDRASVSRGLKIQALGKAVLRYGLVVVLAWIGAMKFTGYEAKGMEPLIAHSPFMGWMYRLLTLQQVSNGLGVVEIGMAVSIALGPWFAKVGAFGSAVAVLTFLTTLSFLFSTPGWEPSLGGFPALSGDIGGFLLKDILLLGASILLFGEAWESLSRTSARSAT